MRRRHRGSALVIVMIFVAVFGALALGFLQASDSSLKSAALQAEARRARAAAESGMAFARGALPCLQLPSAGTTTGETLEAIADALNANLAGTVFSGASATVSGDTVQLPAVILNFAEGPARFDLEVVAGLGDTFAVRSTGTVGDARQTIASAFRAEDDTRLLTSYGVASRSRIVMKGSARIDGANDPSEGSVLSTSQVFMDPIDIFGHVYVSGDVAITNPDGDVSLRGNANVGGDILIGVPEPPFPEIDISVFEPYAVNVLDPEIHTYSSDVYLENVRIPANTNPTFTANTLIRGVVYVESPNQVTFTGHVAVIGVIVAETPEGELDLADNQIRFTGNTATLGTGSLPEGAPQFSGLQDLDGSFILAPGYNVEFTGSFSTLNGSVAASKLTFGGDASGTVKGSILNYHDTQVEISGNSHLLIDHSDLDQSPAGMVFPRRLVYVAGTYSEG